MTQAETRQIRGSWKGNILMWVYSILMGLPIILVFIFFNYYSLHLVMYAGWLVLAFSVVIIMHACTLACHVPAALNRSHLLR